MQKVKQWLILGAVIAPMAALSLGCSSSSSGGGGGSSCAPGSCPVIDLAVGDVNAGYETITSFPNYQVLIYLDVLNDAAGGLQDPDVRLDDLTSGLTYPRNVLLAGGDLYVSQCGGDVLIFRDYNSLADGAAPDVTLNDDGTGAATMSCPKQMQFGNDTLIVAGEGDSRVFLYDAASSIAAPQAPTVALTTELVNTDGVYYNSTLDTLWVANWTSTLANTCVGRYDDVAGIISGGVDVAPDASLTVGGSFLEIGDCRRLWQNEPANVLYVATQDSGTGGEDVLYAFEDATGFSDDALPDAVIAHTGTQLLNPIGGAILNNRLYIANRNTGDEDECKNLPGLVGFDLSATGGLVSGQSPSVNLGGTVSGVAGAQDIKAVGGFLFTVALNACQSNEGFGSVKIFSGGSGGPSTNDAPFLTLPALKDFATAITVDAAFPNSTTP